MSAPSSFELALLPGDEGVVARFSGELDLAAAPEVERALTGLFDDGERRVVCDLSGVSFVDSSGLRALTNAMLLAEQRGGELVLRSPGEPIARLLKITRLDSRFTVEE